MALHLVRVLTTSLVLLAVAPGLASAGFRAGFDGTALPANDDGSSGANALGFTANYFGTDYSSAYVNNNGNLTFRAASGEFFSDPLSTSTVPLVAPLFYDVDTRGAGSGLVKYGAGTVDGRTAFGATWGGVGSYFINDSRLNSFQAVLIDRADTGAGNFDIEFNYTAVTTDYFGTARVGYTAGTAVAGTYYEFPGSATAGALIDGGPNSLTANSVGSDVAGRYVFAVRNGLVGPADSVATPAPAGLLVGLAGAAGLAAARRRRA